jgi:hypothetical protein
MLPEDKNGVSGAVFSLFHQKLEAIPFPEGAKSITRFCQLFSWHLMLVVGSGTASSP